MNRATHAAQDCGKLTMARTQTAKWNDLDSQDDRKVAHIAAIARADTIHGGARAMVIARKCSQWDALEVVAAVYGASTGKHSRHYEAWECPECGQVHLGMDNADECCAFDGDGCGEEYADDMECVSDDNWACGTLECEA